MSLFLIKDKHILSFNTFCLGESLKSLPTEFGTDLFNKKIMEYETYKITFFKHNNLYYQVMYDESTNEIGFGVSDKWEDNPSIEFINDEFSDDRKQTASALKVFNKVMYIVIQMIKDFNIDKIKFSPSNPALGKVYDLLHKNKYFMDELLALGFDKYNNKNGYYVFSKNN